MDDECLRGRLRARRDIKGTARVLVKSERKVRVGREVQGRRWKNFPSTIWRYAVGREVSRDSRGKKKTIFAKA